MSDVVERNDVDISKLFNWGMAWDIIDPRNNDEKLVTVYMKLLGDADLSRARVYAMRKSAELRRKLRDLDSDERIAYIKDISEVSVEDLINLITLFSSREISKAAQAKVRVPAPKPPKSNAKLEKLEKFQKDVDDYPERRRKAIAEAIQKEIDSLHKELSQRSKEDLYAEYVRGLIDEFCERAALVAFEDMQTYLGCYLDDSYKSDARFFKDFEEFDNLEPTVKYQFKDAYKGLDIELAELKKLRRATP